MEILPNLTPGYLFMLGWSAASKITYVRPVGGPENTSNIGENPNINSLASPPRPSPEPPRRFFCPKMIYGPFSGLTFWLLTLGMLPILVLSIGSSEKQRRKIQLQGRDLHGLQRARSLLGMSADAAKQPTALALLHKRCLLSRSVSLTKQQKNTKQPWQRAQPFKRGPIFVSSFFSVFLLHFFCLRTIFAFFLYLFCIFSAHPAGVPPTLEKHRKN